MKKQRKQIETPIKDIVDYWSVHQDESGLSVDWIDADKRCWRCANQRQLQKCHIIPHSLGGTEHPSNLVLLCSYCHSEAPNVNDPNFMWIWLRAHACKAYDIYWYQRGWREYEIIFNKPPFQGIEHSEENFKYILKVMAKYLSSTSIHFAQGKINPSTVAWVLRKIERELLGE